MDPPPDCSSCYMKFDEIVPSVGKDEIKKAEKKKSELMECQEPENKDRISSTLLSDGPGTSHSTTTRHTSSDSTVSVRSSAVVKYCAAKNPAVFSPLAPETNLNLAPSNWLRKTVGLRPEILFPGGRYTGGPERSFSGMSMAMSHLDSVGKVDVISDAENIKKLLKIPYSKAHVSMAIHRIGRTLLLENFDIKRYTTEGEWEWFRNFFDKLPQHCGNKKKSPTSQYERLMLSKFLYYSVNQGSYADNLEGNQENDGDVNIRSTEAQRSDIKLVEIDDKIKEEKSENSEDIRSAHLEELTRETSSLGPAIPLSDLKREENNSNKNALVAAEKRWRYWTPHDSQPMPEANQAFERNILWTFEDLQMMLGTNMPIFGAGTHPAVSLKLRDSNKPINILTGIDYWLDNLICNVPELLMCFHVNGIVQNYEVIKTEDIPQLEHSSFSPQVIKDIAQNILSFLKSNCTKEGHTYWLFKGSGDDVVKLYDLTTLCDKPPSSSGNESSDKTQNPYIYSVAILLYKTAINLMQSKDTCDHHITVKRLLCHCIDLLDHTKHQYIVSSAICMLSTLCLPDPRLDVPTNKETLNSPIKKESGLKNEMEDNDWCDTCTAYHDNVESAKTSKETESPGSSELPEVASIPCVTDLKYQPTSLALELFKSPQTKEKKKPPSGKSAEQISQVKENCHTALSYIVTGLKVLTKDGTEPEDWQKSLLQQLTRNAGLAYFRLAEQANSLGKYGRALRCAKLALQSLETYEFLSNSGQHGPAIDTDAELERTKNQNVPPDFHLFLPRLLSLCGEVQFAVVQYIKRNGSVSAVDCEEHSLLNEEDKEIKNALMNITASENNYVELTRLSSEIDQALDICLQCYQMAIDAMGDMKDDTKPKTSTNKERKKAKQKPSSSASSSSSVDVRRREVMDSLRTTLIRRLGHVANELGATAINHVVTRMNRKSKQEAPGSKETELWTFARMHFETAHRAFVRVHDVINQALVLSNMGRMMRVYAQFFANSKDGTLSQQERCYFKKAIDNYQKALTLLAPKDGKRCSLKSDNGVTCTSVYDNISWELSSSFYSMGQILQDNAPIDARTSETEKEVIDLLSKSLRHCQDIWEKLPKQPLAQYRQAQIYERMASLYHHSYRNCNDANKCKHLRSLADKNYVKAITVLEGLDHPCDLIRFQLEQLAMKEYYIASLKNVSQKEKVLLEGLTMMLNCLHPLQQIANFTQIATIEAPSEDDAREQPSSRGSDSPVLTRFPSADIYMSSSSECFTLLSVLATILQAFLLLLVKTTTTTAANSPSPKGSVHASKAQQESYKELCRLTLRELQPVKAGPAKLEPEPGENMEERKDFLQSNISRVLNILKEVETVLKKP